MRKKIVAGNWKMNLSLEEGISLVNEINTQLKPSEVEVIVIPPFIHLNSIKDLISSSKIQLGAQNVHAEQKGAFTGEVSALMLKSVGVDYCLVGHSERRIYQNESEEELEVKLTRLLEESMIPVFCIGESLIDRKSGNHFDVIKQQLKVLQKLTANEISNCIIAYEPVWAIGTGETASAEQAEEMHSFIRQLIVSSHGEDIAESMSILYGGSCKPNNAVELFSQPNVDGGLIGGASLNAEDFISIIEAH